MQNPPLTTQARADYTEAIRQLDEEISDIDEVTVIKPDPRRDLASWHLYLDFRRRREEATAERDRLRSMVGTSGTIFY